MFDSRCLLQREKDAHGRPFLFGAGRQNAPRFVREEKADVSRGYIAHKRGCAFAPQSASSRLVSGKAQNIRRRRNARCEEIDKKIKTKHNNIANSTKSVVKSA